MSLCQFSDLLFKIAPSQDVFTLLIIYKTNIYPLSGWIDILAWIRQGSILGSFLFDIYFNDLLMLV